MKDKQLIKISKILLATFATIYLLFLILPFALTPILQGYSPKISEAIKKDSGFNMNFDKMQIVTTPKLTVGLKIKKIEALLPNNERFLQADNFQVKLSLLPILLGKIELDSIGTENIIADLKIQKDGKFLIENYIPKSEQAEQPTQMQKPAKMFFKLSNHLPNIKIDKYSVNFIDIASAKKYSIVGNETKVSDFILNKKVKIAANAKLVLDGQEQFVFDIKLFNKIMPNVELNDLVFNPQVQEEKPETVRINPITIFRAIHENQLSANLKADLSTYGSFEEPKIDGLVNINGLTISVNNKKLPDSSILLKLKKNKIILDSDIYTNLKEITHINGELKTGKHPNIDLTFKSNANLKSVVDITKSVAKTFGVNDLQTVSANGAIDADFNIKSNLKKVQSSGYFKIPNGTLNYGLYKVAINNINSDISFDNDLINIKHAGFSVLEHPLNVYGTIKQDATADINVIANNLSLKSLLIAAGQASVLKDNQINSGILTLNAKFTGRLDKPNATADVLVSNVNIKNIPTASTVLLENQHTKMTFDKQGYKGLETLNGFKIINPAAIVYMPKLTANIKPNEITINPANLSVDKINLIISGKIKNYLTNKMVLEIQTNGHIKSNLNGVLNAASQTVNLDYSIPTPCTFPIPGFANSKIQTRGNLSISSKMANPKLKGTFIVPYILLPDMLVSMNDLTVNLNGPILKGNGTVKKITSGSVVATNLSSDFSLVGNLFNLNNISGDAYSGKVNGDVVYNIVNGKTAVDFKGYDMKAAPAILATSGIKDALDGNLDFNTKITLQGMTYEQMVKSLKGNFSFSITDGTLGKIGKLETFLNAQNILANAVMKTALNYILDLSTIQETSKFKYIKGDMSFSNGWANISSIKISGPTMSYFVKGKYNILKGTTNVIVLGRLSSDVVALLGPIGDLSVDKLTSYIPKFGALTAVIIKSMTTSPEDENISAIPPLTGNNAYHKDFKVVFNGGLDSKSSVKSFKWLSDVDTSVFDLKFNVKDVKKQFADAKKSNVEGVKKQYSDLKDSTVSGVKGTVNDTKKQLQDAAGEWKNLLKF